MPRPTHSCAHNPCQAIRLAWPRGHSEYYACSRKHTTARSRRPWTAPRLFASLEALGDEIGTRGQTVEELSEETLTIVREQIDEAVFAEAWEQGRRMTMAEAVTLALAS